MRSANRKDWLMTMAQTPVMPVLMLATGGFENIRDINLNGSCEIRSW